MVGILASQGCCCHSNHLINQQKTMENLSFSSSVSTLERLTCKPTITNGLFQFLVQMKHTESPSTLGINGRPVKMVPIGEVLGRHPQLSHNIDTVNGSKQSVNGSVVKRKSSSALVRTPKGKGLKELPPIGELKDTLSHQNFSWSNENYNSLQRSIDIWLFVISFYIRIQLDDTKWTYFGGFMEDKQVNLADI